MNRKHFLKQSLQGLGAIVALPAAVGACAKDDTLVPDTTSSSSSSTSGSCTLSPGETAGPYPIKTPAQLVRENIISDRLGIALLITITVQKQSDNCGPLAGVLVDLWHCDAGGNYSEYGSYTSVDFLRGRQTTDANGKVSFISIFPGWYPGRATHIHLEVLNSSGTSLRVTQIAFPKEICDTVYSTTNYNGTADTLNANDGIFKDSLSGNMADSITGNTTDGYTLLKTVVV